MWVRFLHAGPKLSMKLVAKPVQITIHHNWDKLLNSYDQIHLMWQQGRLKTKQYHDSYQTYFIDLGGIGSLQLLDNLCTDEKTASFLHGNLVETNLPWLSKLREDFADLDIAAISLFSSCKDVLPHRDFEPDNQTQGHICKINYVIKTADAEIFVNGDQGTESYSCLKGLALLMDVERDHGLTSNGNQVYTFQISFHKQFEEVAEWFDRHSEFEYGQVEQ